MALCAVTFTTFTVFTRKITPYHSKIQLNSSRQPRILARIEPASNQRTVYNKCRVGARDVVGYGVNGSANYKDDPAFPFPAVRFKPNTRDILALRQKERGNWQLLCCEEKKALYRASFCQTFAEFQAPTGQWKLVAGWVLILLSGAFWGAMYSHYYIYESLPISVSQTSQKVQLRRMLELHVNPIDGLASTWDYDNDRWKSSKSRDKPK